MTWGSQGDGTYRVPQLQVCPAPRRRLISRYRLSLVRDAVYPYEQPTPAYCPVIAALGVLGGFDRELVGALYLDVRKRAIGHTVVAMVAGVALYVVLPESLLGLATFRVFQGTANRSPRICSTPGASPSRSTGLPCRSSAISCRHSAISCRHPASTCRYTATSCRAAAIHRLCGPYRLKEDSRSASVTPGSANFPPDPYVRSTSRLGHHPPQADSPSRSRRSSCCRCSVRRPQHRSALCRR